MPNRLPLLFVLLFLSGFLLATASVAGAQASAAPAAAPEEELEGLEGELEEEEEEEDFAEVECEAAYEEAEEGELALEEAEEICAEVAAIAKGKRNVAKKKGAGSVAPEECLLRSAHAHAVVNEKSRQLKLTVGYTAYEPVGATIKVGNLLTVKRRLGRSGVLRIVKDLGEAKTPKRVLVRLAIPASPDYCSRYGTERVRVR